MLTNTLCFSPTHIPVERKVIFHFQHAHEPREHVHADTKHMWTRPKPSPLLVGCKYFGTLFPNSWRGIVPEFKDTFPVDQQIFKGPSSREAEKKKITYQKGCKNIMTIFETTSPVGHNLTRCNGRKVRGFKQSKASLGVRAYFQHKNATEFLSLLSELDFQLV